MAILAETGKYPIIMKIYTYIIKYWLRISTTENKLLNAAYTNDKENQKNGKQSWGIIVNFLLQVTAMKGSQIPKQQNEIKAFIKNFKIKLMSIFDEW